MTIASVSGTSNPYSASTKKDESVNQDYTALIEQFYQVQAYQSGDQKNASDTELQQFKHDLLTKGAAQFLKDLNEEKINALVEEYRQKLLAEKAQNPEKPMDINQMVSDFRKQLLKEMMEAQKADQQGKSKQDTTALMSQDLLEKIQTTKNENSSSNLLQTGFLEQMLSATPMEAKKNQPLI